MGRPTNAEREAKKNAQIAPPDDTITLMQQRIDKLEEALSRIAHVTGSFNYISDLGIKRWTPGKEHMGKKYG